MIWIVYILIYLIIVGVMISAYLLVYNAFRIGEDPSDDPIPMLLLAVFWPVTLIPWAMYVVVSVWIKGRDA